MIARRGSTLIELVLSMMAGSGVMLLGISLVHQSMLLSEKSSNRADNNRTLDQLAHCFRRDMHAATQWAIDAQGALTVTCSDNSRVTYSLQTRSVVRERSIGQSDFEREHFSLAVDATARFDSMQDPVRVSLTVGTSTVGTSRVLPDDRSAGAQERLDLMVECMPGKWKSLERSEGVRP